MNTRNLERLMPIGVKVLEPIGPSNRRSIGAVFQRFCYDETLPLMNGDKIVGETLLSAYYENDILVIDGHVNIDDKLPDHPAATYRYVRDCHKLPITHPLFIREVLAKAQSWYSFVSAQIDSILESPIVEQHMPTAVAHVSVEEAAQLSVHDDPVPTVVE